MTIQTSPSDINLYSITLNGVAYNPSATTDPSNWQTLNLPSPLNLNPANILSFASALKICDGATNKIVNVRIVGQGQEGCLDISNGVTHVTVKATQFGSSITPQGQRVGSIKGGCEDIVIFGEPVCSGTLCTWLIGSYCDQSQKVDKNIDLTNTLGGTIIIGRGFFAYLLGNWYSHKLGSNKLLFWYSFGFWWYIRGKTILVWLLNQKWVPTKVKKLLDSSYTS